MEEHWTATSFSIFRLGEIKAMTPMAQSQAKPNDGTINKLYEMLYDRLQKGGVLQLLQDRDLSQQQFSWDNFSALSQEGIRRIFVAELLPSYKRLICNDEQMKFFKLPEKAIFACIPMGSGNIKEIVRNESKEAGIDKYQVLYGTYHWKHDSTWMIVSGQLNADSQRKFRALLKYDPFIKKWTVPAWDWGELEGDFVSDNVGKLIAKQ